MKPLPHAQIWDCTNVNKNGNSKNPDQKSKRFYVERVILGLFGGVCTKVGYVTLGVHKSGRCPTVTPFCFVARAIHTDHQYAMFRLRPSSCHSFSFRFHIHTPAIIFFKSFLSLCRTFLDKCYGINMIGLSQRSTLLVLRGSQSIKSYLMSTRRIVVLYHLD